MLAKDYRLSIIIAVVTINSIESVVVVVVAILLLLLLSLLPLLLLLSLLFTSEYNRLFLMGEPVQCPLRLFSRWRFSVVEEIGSSSTWDK